MPQAIRDLPIVFLSYDEPWADRSFADLRSKAPGAERVHGVKGLDACHKAAARLIDGDWLITVDADTIVDAAFFKIDVPDHLLGDQFRLDWLSRNAVTGQYGGNGCLKLWPRSMILAMRTHESAPGDVVSLDHEIGAIHARSTGQITMPDRCSETDPAQTPCHAFRAGFREAAFLAHIADANPGSLARKSLILWAALGRHLPHGRWSMLGARSALLMPVLLPGWNVRAVNDHDWLSRLWRHRVLPRFGGPDADSL